VLILGAAGRDFHNFNVVYRDDATEALVEPMRAEAAAAFGGGVEVATDLAVLEL
jgi:predicted GTPase